LPFEHERLRRNLRALDDGDVVDRPRSQRTVFDRQLQPYPRLVVIAENVRADAEHRARAHVEQIDRLLALDAHVEGLRAIEHRLDVGQRHHLGPGDDTRRVLRGERVDLRNELVVVADDRADVRAARAQRIDVVDAEIEVLEREIPVEPEFLQSLRIQIDDRRFDLDHLRLDIERAHQPVVGGHAVGRVAHDHRVQRGIGLDADRHRGGPRFGVGVDGVRGGELVEPVVKGVARISVGLVGIGRRTRETTPSEAIGGRPYRMRTLSRRVGRIEH